MKPLPVTAYAILVGLSGLASDALPGARADESNKIRTITLRGERVDLEGYLVKGKHTLFEFYADWSSFDVTLRAPAAYEGRIGATGSRAGDVERRADDTVAVRFTAEPVHDFAWVAGEDFLVKTFQFRGGAGVFPEEQRRVAQHEPGRLSLPGPRHA